MLVDITNYKKGIKLHINTSNQPQFNIGFGEYTCNWGAHMAGLYETEEERDKIIIGLFHEGFKQGDLQLFCSSDQSSKNFVKNFLLKSNINPDWLKSTDRFQLYSTQDFYFADDFFSPETMGKNLNSFYKESKKNGLRNIRSIAEMDWLLDVNPIKEHLMAYESCLNYFIPDKSWINICLYNVNNFNGDIIMNALHTHPYIISKSIITENPYFQDPSSWLRENAPEFLPKISS